MMSDTIEHSQTSPVVARISGQTLSELPKDLYIPPDALEVFLEAFEGPLDLLLYLIKKHNLEILDIPIAEITRQYMSYIELMQSLRLELAADYLVMAATLAEIKSRMLLPRPVEAADEEDPRSELIRRLQEYELFKKAAQDLDALPRVGRDILLVKAIWENDQRVRPLPSVELKDLLIALKDVFERAKLHTHHLIRREALSIRERMSQILTRLQPDQFLRFDALFNVEEGRMGVVVTFIAILELLKQSMLEMVQNEPFAPIHVKAVS